MKYEITKEFQFDSSHRLPGEEIFGKCSNLHGHTYKLFVTVGANELENGMVMNFNELKVRVNKLIDKMDHQFLNNVDFLKDKYTTCENMVETIFNELQKDLEKDGITIVKIVEVKLYETPNSYGCYRG